MAGGLDSCHFFPFLFLWLIKTKKGVFVEKSKKYKLEKYRSWNKEIFKAVEDFMKTQRVPPHLLFLNNRTGLEFDIMMNAALIGTNEHPGHEIRFTNFGCELAELEVLLDESLNDKEFLLVN
jgi:hypothetical protein